MLIPCMHSRAHLGVHGITLAPIFAALTLGRRPSFLLDLKEWSVGMRAPRHAMAFDACRTSEFLVVDEDHGGYRSSREPKKYGNAA